MIMHAELEEFSADVLIVGGGTGAHAAIEAAKHGLRVVLVDKGRFGRSGSTPTSGGSPHALLPQQLGGDPADSREAYLRDMVVGGEFLSDQDISWLLAEEGALRVRELDAFGVPFEKGREGRFVAVRTLGESYPRVGRVRGGGRALMDALVKETFRRGVGVVENTMVTRLLTRRGVVVGAMGLDVRTGALRVFPARATVLAAGSATGLYLEHSANLTTTGDAFALAFEVGAHLMNMEFQEFTLVPAPFGRVIRTGQIKAVTGRGAKFYNNRGERFMRRYDPVRMELTTRAGLVLAAAKEVRAGRDALLDVRHFKEPYSHIARVERMGFDWRRERIPYRPVIHNSLGGIRTDSWGQTGVPGLYACGEAAGFAGAFGADRVGGALIACHVFAQRAGRHAARLAQAAGRRRAVAPGAQVRAEGERLASLRGRVSVKRGSSDPHEVAGEIRTLAEAKLHILKSGEGIAHALDELARIRREELSRMRAADPRAQVRALEAWNLALTAELFARSALLRTESRGHHYRDDFPARDDEKWLKWVVLRRGRGGKIISQLEPIPIQRYPFKPG